jgi:hypothetical protein
MLRIGMALDPKWESTLVDFIKANLDVFALVGMLSSMTLHYRH